MAKRWWTRRRFDAVELALAVGLTALIGWAASHRRPALAPAAAELIERYGPHRNSRNLEELIVRDFFQDRRGGFFLDVGASHYQFESNTYFLETALGWSGIAVEPQAIYAADYGRYRPRTAFRPFFAADVSDADAKLYYLESNPRVSSGEKAFTERYGSGAQVIQARTITLDDLLDREGVKKIDFLSMDIELAEPKALAGFDVGRFAPELVCIEGHPEVRQAIIDYFAAHGYAIVGKYLHADFVNLYFSPGPAFGPSAGHAR
jgi:FkbM family methyltransferase